MFLSVSLCMWYYYQELTDLSQKLKNINTIMSCISMKKNSVHYRIQWHDLKKRQVWISRQLTTFCWSSHTVQNIFVRSHIINKSFSTCNFLDKIFLYLKFWCLFKVSKNMSPNGIALIKHGISWCLQFSSRSFLNTVKEYVL